MACSLPAVLYSATSLVSLGSPKNVRGLEGRSGGAALAWRGRGRECRPLVAASNIETASFSSSSSEPAEQQGPPVIELQFLSPLGLLSPSVLSLSKSKPLFRSVDLTMDCKKLKMLEPESASDSQTFSIVSGEKNLRKFIVENKLELYDFYFCKLLINCGGGGTCGTCIVEILEGQDLLGEKTDAEYKHLKKKPESWRLSCQTIVRDKSNSGKVVVQRLPQTKK